MYYNRILMPVRSDNEIRFANLEYTGIHEILLVYEVYVSQHCITCILFPMGFFFIPERICRTSKKAERETFGGIKHSVYETAAKDNETQGITRLTHARQDFVKIAFSYNLKAIRSISRDTYNIYQILFDVGMS